MTIDEKNPEMTKKKSLAEDISDQVMSATRGATKAVEAEAAVMRKLEDAYRKVNETITEVRHAIKAEADATVELNQARNIAKQAIVKVKNATQKEEKADKELKYRSDKLKAELEKVRKAEERGNLPNINTRDKAKRQATEAEQKAKLAHNEGDKAREILAVTNAEVKAVQERLMMASARIHKGKGERAAAKGKVAHIEHDARQVILEAKKALEIQASAKKGMDRTIRGLRTVMQNEARLAQAAEEAQAQTELNSQETATKARITTELLIKRIKTLMHPEVKIVKVIQAATAKTRRGPKSANEIREAIKNDIDVAASETTDSGLKPELYSGMVRILVVGPTNLTRVARIQENLERDHGCRVKSVGGGSSGEGTCIIIQADQPVDLLPRLRDLEFVEWISGKGKEIEVTLKPLSDTSKQKVERKSYPPEPTVVKEKTDKDLLDILSH